MKWPDDWPLSAVPPIRAAQLDEGPGRCFGCGEKLPVGLGRRRVCCDSRDCVALYHLLYGQHRRQPKREANPGAWRARRREAISRGHRRRLYVPPVTLGSEEAARLADSTFGGGP